MKRRTHSYIGTFNNDVEGNAAYKELIGNIRKVLTGGRFVKMFRGNKRTFTMRQTRLGTTYKYPSGSSKREGATHFDVYILGHLNFLGFKLVPIRPW